MKRRWILGILLLPCIAVAAPQRDAEFYRPINGIRTMADIISGVQSQSLEAHQQFESQLRELASQRPFPLRLEDGNEVFRLVLFRSPGQGDQYFLFFRDKPCIDSAPIFKALGSKIGYVTHSPLQMFASDAYVETRAPADKCLSSLRLTMKEIPDRADGRTILNGSVAASQVATLVSDMAMALKGDAPYEPLERLWRSQGEAHDDAVRVLKADFWHPNRGYATKYNYVFADGRCIDVAPFHDVMKEARPWSVVTFPNRSNCVKSLTYYVPTSSQKQLSK